MTLFHHVQKEKMQSCRNGAIFVLLSFMLPLLIIMLALAWLGVTPFGEKTLLISDADGLYINYLAYFGRMIKGLEGFTYSFEKGLGGNMLPNIGITMLDPFFLIFAVFGIRNYPVAFTFVSLLNCSVCGLTMYLLLAELYGHKRSNLIFSTSYALMGFNVANLFQVFFFSGVQMLPLMVLGLRRLIRGESSLLYILALGYAILTSYYFGFMLCVASVLFFFLLLWLYREQLEGKRLRAFLKYTLCSVLAGILGAIVWLPALLGIRDGRLSQTNVFYFSFKENMPLLSIGAKLFSGANNTDELKNGLPNIFVGILPLALSILFFINKEINIRKKTAAGVALGFYLLCFYIVAFNMLMHGGTVTNWFNFRYSFVFSFLLILLAAEQWKNLDAVSMKECRTCGAVLVLASILVFSDRYEFVTGGAVVLDFTLLMLMFLAFRMHVTDAVKNPRRMFEYSILLLCSFQLTMNYYLSTKELIKEEKWATRLPAYQATVDAVAPLFDGLKAGDPGFYRMEVNGQRSGNCGNDPMLYGYNGVGHSGSYERSFIRPALNKLGVHWFDTRNYYEPGIPAPTDTLLGLRYIISREDLSAEKGYVRATHYDEIELFKGLENYDIYYNPDALPIAFLASSTIDSVETDFVNVFENLNRTWTEISGQEKLPFNEETEITFSAHNLFDMQELTLDKARTIVETHDRLTNAAVEAIKEGRTSIEVKEGEISEAPEFSAYIEYTWTAKQDGSIYTYNRGILETERGASPPVLKYLGEFKAGDMVTGYIPLDADFVNRIASEEICGRFRAAYADPDALHELASIVKERPCTVEKVRESHLRGEFTAGAGQMLMFTIPWDEGWTCFIDGEEAEIKQVLGVFMAVDAPAGTHSYEMKFFPVGMKTGIGLSAAALLTTAVYIPVDSRRRKKAGAPDNTLDPAWFAAE